MASTARGKKRKQLAEPSSDDVAGGDKTSRGRGKTPSKAEPVQDGGEANKKAPRKRLSAKDKAAAAAPAKAEEDKENVQDCFVNYYQGLGVDCFAPTGMIHEAHPCHGCDNAMRQCL